MIGGAESVVTPATLYAEVDTYRWFLFWFEHDAMVRWEVQPGGNTGFGYYDLSSFVTPITDLNSTKTHGSFSPLSKRIYVVISSAGDEAFSGECQ